MMHDAGCGDLSLEGLVKSTTVKVSNIAGLKPCGTRSTPKYA
ncbi:MAG: hypothetical protein NOU37_07975 [Candidatus Brocadiales bacterium]|nr:hypothetical protein [Candidatus Bathyanammoxibius amoris]